VRGRGAEGAVDEVMSVVESSGLIWAVQRTAPHY
jgi:hypothetical protein